MRLLRWTFYIAVCVVSGGLWPPGGPDTKQARDVATLLLGVLGVLVVCAVVIYLTDPRFNVGRGRDQGT